MRLQLRNFARLLGLPAALTGPLAELAPDIVNGSKVYFDSVNEKGGVNGRKIRILTMDDGYVVAVLPLLEKENPPLPLIAPFTGADLMRYPPINHVFNVRASYGDETEKMVQHLTTLGTQRIAVLWSNNGFGKDGLAGVQKALEKRGMKIYAGAPTVSFIKSYNKVRKGMHFYTLSVMGTQATLRALGADGVGVVVSTVVPFPWDFTHPLAREYRAAMHKAGYTNLSFLGLESYINAKVFVEGLRLAGRDLNRTKFVAALAGMKRMDLGGFAVGFGKDSRQGSRFVGLTMVSSGEKFTK